VANVTGVRLKMAGINELMRSAPVQAEVTRRAQRIAAAAGPGFTVKTKPHKWTARAYVIASTPEARRREAEDKVLLAALSAGGGA
jgi:hypothetical protein